MKIGWLPISPRLASGRLRRLIPAQQLQMLGHEIAADVSDPMDVLILAKHDWPEFDIRARRTIYDVCDDHFDDEWAGHYRHWIDNADLVTCNSREMQRIIWDRCRRHAVVIDDPYESDERPAKCHAPALWFGASHNLIDLIPIADQLPDLVVVSDADGKRITRWSPATMRQAWGVCGLVVLPTGKRQAKSANRAVESIRNGLYPVCGHLPAYHELGLGVNDVPGKAWELLDDPTATREKVRELQALVRDRFSPATVGKAWADAVNGVCDTPKNA